MLQLNLNSGQMNGRLCDFAVEEFACASVRHQNISVLNYCCVKLFQCDLQHVFSFIIHLLSFHHTAVRLESRGSGSYLGL